MFSFLYKTIIGLVSFLVACSTLMAMEINEEAKSISEPLSIAELLDIALCNNPETRAIWWNANRAANSAAIAKSAYYPSIGLRGTAVNGLDYRYINGQKTNFTTASTDIVLNYLLFDFGERGAASEAAKAALASANWQSDWALQKVMYEVIYNAYVFLNAQEQLTSRQESLKEATYSLEAAKELQSAGLRSVTDVYSLKASVSDMEIGIALQKAETEIARGKLAASLGLDVDSKLLVAALPEPDLDRVMQEELKKLIETAHQKRSDLMAKRSDLNRQIANRKKIGKACLPKLKFNGDTGYRRYFEDKSNGFNYTAGLYLDVPLFNGFEQTYHNNIALSDVRISEIELEQLELNVALEVLTHSLYFDAAQAILQLARDNLLNSNMTFEGVLTKYKAGTQSIFELTAAQKQLADARLKQSDAKTSWYRTLAQLAYATGSIMPKGEVPCLSVE